MHFTKWMIYTILYLFNFMQDTFFYSLVYDPQQKTLLADKGEIRVGPSYQAEPTPMLKTGIHLVLV